jgi:molybdopterin molybdotransferase
MLSFDKALEIVLGSVPRMASERVDIGESLGRILAEDVKSDMDMPPFNKSAMDGYACRRSDLGSELLVIETIAAGYQPKKTVGPGLCSKIMTGGMVPEGADCVVMIEYVEAVGDNKIRFVGEKTSDNICLEGEDIRAGDIVLKKGTLTGPQHIAVLASVGCAKPFVAKRPKVGVIATGDELVDPQTKPGISQIRNSNSFGLCAQITRSGALAQNYGIARDSNNEIDATFKQAVGENDLVLVSGGVSMGDFDLVPGIMESNGFELLFEKIAVKPGRPTVFGVSDGMCCFGLPGNPVSTFVIFELLVKPFLYAMTGCDNRGGVLLVPLAKSVRRKKTEREAWIPVTITDEGKAVVVEYHGSGHINALCLADGLLCMPAGVGQIEEGATVAIRQI